MKNKKTILIVVLVVVLSFGVHLLMAQTQTSTNPRNERWEYTSLNANNMQNSRILERANRLGSEGWEFVASYAEEGVAGSRVLIFKRRLP